MSYKLVPVVGVTSIFASVAAMAQTADTDVAEVVVTATRIERDGYTAPTPTTVIGQALIEQRAIANVGDALNKVPSFRAGVTPSAGGLGNTGAFLADLRGLGPTRTLVLLDRGRLPQTIVPGAGGAGTTDLNTIPTALISNAEVVTGGASAAWGSDAVAGVINFTLNDHMEGVKGTAQYGETRYGDAQDTFVSLAGGHGFADGRAHAVLGLEYNKDEGTGAYNTERGWGREGWGVLTFTNRPAGVPFSVIAPNSNYFGSATTGGLITTAGPLQGLAFVPTSNGGVTTATFTRGLGNMTTSLDTFSDAAIAANAAAGIVHLVAQQLRPAQERYNALAKFTFEFNDHLSAYVEPLYSRVTTDGIILTRRDGAGAGPALTIARDNPYLQQALTPAQLALVPVAGISLGYAGNQFGPNQREIEKELIRVQAALQGDFGDSWKWDVTYVSGRVDSDVAISNNFNNVNFRNAIDAVTVNGQVVCRNAAARAAGCVPINILGAPTVSEAAANYILGTATGNGRATLDDVSVNLQGEPFSTWADSVSIGVGADYREESVRLNTDPLSQSTSWLTGTGQPLPRVSNDVKEVYGETIVPLARDLSFARSLDFNGAIRLTDYHTSGSVQTWKAGLTWQPVDGLLFRTTRSRDIRAPNLIELFTPQTQSLPLPADPRPGFARPTNTAGFIVGGNPDLTPEKSTTQTIGVSFQPSFVSNLKLSMDFYDIQIDDAISSTSTQGVVNNCFIGGVYTGNSWCSLITFANNDPVNGVMTGARGITANAAEFSTRGIDFQSSYRKMLGSAGTLTLNFLATHVMSFESSTDVSALFPNGIDRAGQTGAAFGGAAALPKWLLNLSFGYEIGAFEINGNARRISKSRQNNGAYGPDQSGYDPALSTSISSNRIPAVNYLDLGVRYQLGGRFKGALFFNVDNVFDKDPPLPASGTAYYDLLGRTYKGGVRFSF